MSFGPIQMLAVGFGKDAEFRGEILDELESLSGRGLIRLIDLLFVTKSATGEVAASQASELSVAEAMEFGALIGGLIGLGADGAAGAQAGAAAGALAMVDQALGLGVADVQGIAQELEPGESAGILLFEHTWAAGLRDAIRRAGGVPLVQGFLTPEALMMIGAELQATVEAQQAIEVADAVKGAALLDALVTVEAAAQVKTAAAAEAIQALIVAGLIVDAAAEEAVDALVMAGLIEEAALAEAEQVVAQVEAEVAEARAALAAAEGEDG